jgi:tetratricopeptide (TPR) repeat protein
MIKLLLAFLNYLVVLKNKILQFLGLNSNIRIYTDLSNYHLVFIISLTTCITYFNSLGIQKNSFDESTIYNNESILSGFKGIPDLLNDNYQFGQGPLAPITFAIEQEMFGTKEVGFPIQYAWDRNYNGIVEPDEDTNSDHIINAEDYMIRGVGVRHFNQILIFVLTVLLLFLLTAKYLLPGKSWLVFIGVMLFATHPVNSQVVNDLSYRYILLSLFFIMLSNLFFFRMINNGGKGNLFFFTLFVFMSFISSSYSLLLLIFFPLQLFLFQPHLLNIKSKLHVIGLVALVLVPLIIIFYPFTKWIIIILAVCVFLFGNLKERFMMLICGIVASLSLFALFENNLFTAFLMQKFPSSTSGSIDLIASTNEILALKLNVFLDYIKLLVFPCPLISTYYFYSADLPQLISFKSIFAAVLFLFLIIAFLLSFKNRNHIAVFLLFSILFLLPFLNIFFYTGKIMAEPFIYISSLGFSFIAAFYLFKTIAFLNNHLTKKLPIGFLLFIPLLFSFITINRNADWKSEDKLINADLIKSPDNVNLLLAKSMNLNKEASKEKNQKSKIEKIKTSMQLISKVASLDSNCMSLFKIKSFNFFLLNEVDSALYYAEKTLEKLPDDQEMKIKLTELSKTKMDKAFVYYEKGKLDSAKYFFNQSLKFNSKNTDAYYNLAVISKQQGDTASAINLLNKAIAIKSKNEYLNLLKKLSK